MGSSFYETDLGVSQLSVAELDHIALEKGGVIGTISRNCDIRGRIGMLAGGWTAGWIGTRRSIHYGTLVLIPTDTRSWKVATEGKVRLFMRAGLTRAQAECLHRTHIYFKYELAEVLAKVLANEGQIQALLAHPQGYGPESGRAEWKRAWSAVFGPEGLNISAPREVELARMVTALRMKGVI